MLTPFAGPASAEGYRPAFLALFVSVSTEGCATTGATHDQIPTRSRTYLAGILALCSTLAAGSCLGGGMLLGSSDAPGTVAQGSAVGTARIVRWSSRSTGAGLEQDVTRLRTVLPGAGVLG